MAAEHDYRRRAMTRNIRARRIDDMRQVKRGKNSSMSFLPNSRFMNEFAVIRPT